MAGRVSQGAKRLSYRDFSGSSREAHAAHWAGFEWDAGPVVVACTGEWGTVQVWAATEAEGRRVIGHAAAIANLPINDPSRSEWIVTSSKSPRYGKPGRFRTATCYGLPVVTKRPGPDGLPLIGE
jgi:hypothetical protein